jgi:hypothetical protein
MTVAEAHPSATSQAASSETRPPAPQPRKSGRKWLRRLGITFVAVLILLVAARMALPTMLRRYVNHTIDQNPLYEGEIGTIEVHLYRGAYTIDDVRLLKRTGNVPVPLFAAKKVDLAIQWDALIHGKVVGRIKFEQPELNFVDSGESGDPSQSQTGGDGPWLEMIRDLFPFKINSAIVDNGSIHFRTFNKQPQVDVYLSDLQASVENLKNVRDETTPNAATVRATALAMDTAKLQFQMKFNPFSYRPSFQMAVRLLGLDVTKLNDLARAYGKFDFERGMFDLVVECDAKEGQARGYVKPLFRNLQVLTAQDIKEDLTKPDPIKLFWEALVGVTTRVLSNPPRDQFATVVPFTGDLSNPKVGVLSAVGNILRNAFIRAYLPRLQGNRTPEISDLEFGEGSVVDPAAVGKD